MKQDENREMAQWWLRILRGGTIIYTQAIGSIRSYLAKGNLTLADIGSSEAEIEERRVYGCKLLALHWLQKLRDGTIMFKTNVLSLRNALEEGGLHPEDIGSSDQEIESFLRVDEATYMKWLSRRTPFRTPRTFAYPR